MSVVLSSADKCTKVLAKCSTCIEQTVKVFIFFPDIKGQSYSPVPRLHNEQATSIRYDKPPLLHHDLLLQWEATRMSEHATLPLPVPSYLLPEDLFN